MMVITTETTVRDIALEEPNAIPVLEQFGIDYCCGGQHTLAKACAKSNQKMESVIEELKRQGQERGAAETDWQAAPLSDLIDHIVQRHHMFTRGHLLLIGELAAKVERRHGAAHPEIYKLCELIETMSAELIHHLSCEEKMLFPYIDQLDEGERIVGQAAVVGIQKPLARSMKDHDQTGDELRVLREATNNYLPPDDACTTYRALYRALEDLERDLHRHIHLENNILFPRALKLDGER